MNATQNTGQRVTSDKTHLIGSIQNMPQLGPVTSFNVTFPIQSYYDSTLLESAIIPGASSDGINTTTLQKQQIEGYAVSLAPWSSTPVAVKFRAGGKDTTSTVIVAPGATLHPIGGKFDSFDWGLPHGWLGGGNAQLFVHRSELGGVVWPSSTSEILFHRQRVKILNVSVASVAQPGPGSIPAIVTGVKPAVPGAGENWPDAFPWVRCVNNLGIPQQAENTVQVRPTKTVYKVRVLGLAGGEQVEVLFRRTDALDIDSGGVLPPAGPAEVEHVEQLVITTPAGTQVYPTIVIDNGASNRLGGDYARADFVSAAAALIGQYMDISRYGELI